MRKFVSTDIFLGLYPEAQTICGYLKKPSNQPYKEVSSRKEEIWQGG
jgi:hypothetical protein